MPRTKGESRERQVGDYNSCSVLTSSDDIQVGGIEFLAWLRKIGRERTTGYRWAAKKWIEPVNIGGHLFVTQDEINRFWSRARAGEFAKDPVGICVAGKV